MKLLTTLTVCIDVVVVIYILINALHAFADRLAEADDLEDVDDVDDFTGL